MNAALKPVASPHVMNTYGRLPIAMSHGRGCRLWDTNGKEYLDALGGIAVNTLGHAHPKLVPALQDQVAKLIHCSNYYHVPDQEKLAQLLVERSGLTNAFFCSTGLEANEAALKLARKYGHDKGIERPEIVVYDKAFHGRSIATLSATGNPKVQAGFGPLVEGFIRVPQNDIESLKKATAGNPNVVAVFFETIQGEGGVNPMRAQYLKDVRALCDANDWLLMIDEVQCGMGRTGKWFAHQWAGILPDVMPLAKGLGSGVPVGAVVAGWAFYASYGLVLHTFMQTQMEVLARYHVPGGRGDGPPPLQVLSDESVFRWGALVVQVWSADGQLLATSTANPRAAVPLQAAPGHRLVQQGAGWEQGWRVYTAPSAGPGHQRVQVLQSEQFLQEEVWGRTLYERRRYFHS